MTNHQTPWIEVWPFNGRELKITNSKARVKLSPEVSYYCENLWKPKAEKGWKSSWVAFAKDVSFREDKIEMNCGAMPFHIINGLDNALFERKPFAPELDYVNCLSVGFPTATKDGYIIFQRRPEGVNCPNTLIHEPCGYMTSLAFAPRSECDLETYADDLRLFDIKTQLDSRKEEIAKTFGIDSKLVSYEPLQDFLATDGLGGCELYFSTTGKIDANKSELTLPENQEVFFVPFEDLKDLICNQGKLSRVNQKGYRPSDAKDIPMIGESTIGLMYGYEKLTGEKLDVRYVAERLHDSGLEVTVHDTSVGKNYEFPTRF
jgi:hypothetical protein